jgi:predicted ATP-grasp superfamily ATP-dependent carboligase
MKAIELKKAVLAINPAASSEYFLKRMQETGLILIGFFTTTKFPDYSSNIIDKKYYYKLIISSGMIDHDFNLIKKLDNEIEIISGILGAEVDVEYSYLLLSKLFSDKSNNPNDSVLHYKKYEMNEQIGRCGIPSLRQIKINKKSPYEININKIISIFNPALEPLIIKPNHGSAASKNVKITQSLKDVKNYLLKDKLGLFYSSDEILIQEFAMGDEYFVDCYSYEGKHYIVSIFKYYKELFNGTMMYRYKDILNKENGIYKKAEDYVEKVLTALNYKFGFSHTEIIYTKNGFRLIEINPRISGGHGTSNYISKLKNNLDQIDIYTNLIFKKPNIRKNSARHYRCHYINNFRFCYIEINFELINSISSFHSIKILKPRDNYPEAHDLTQTVAFLILSHDSREQIEYDSKIIMEYEHSGKIFNLAS